jgi:hypothetical protein
MSVRSLPDWKALLQPGCVKALSVAETAPKARFLSGPIEWGGHDADDRALGANSTSSMLEAMLL